MSECKHHLGFHAVEYEESCCRICGDSKLEIALKAEVARLREFFKSEIAHMETWERHAMAARFKQALQDSGDAAGGE